MCSTNASVNLRTGLYDDVYVELPIFANSLRMPFRKGPNGQHIWGAPKQADLDKFISDIRQRTDKFCLQFLRVKQQDNSAMKAGMIEEVLKIHGVEFDQN